MCEFCTKHGEGKKWYLQAKNYGEDLANDLRRRRFVDHFFNEAMRDGRGSPRQGLERLHRTPGILRKMVNGLVSRQMKRDHFGQVVPVEDVEKILDICSGIVRIPCVCRRMTQGKDAAYCMGVSINPHRFFADGIISRDYWNGPDGSGLERLTREQAITLMRDFEKEGLCHSVWAFITPFIGGICNCDRSDCYAMLYTLRERVKLMFRGEYVAEIDPEHCTGCRLCMRQCQFGAIGYSAVQGKCFIDELLCYGCGICRLACQHDSMALRDRASVPAAANLW
jgi:ferredoxin